MSEPMDMGRILNERDEARRERDELKQKLCNRPAVIERDELRVEVERLRQEQNYARDSVVNELRNEVERLKQDRNKSCICTITPEGYLHQECAYHEKQRLERDAAQADAEKFKKELEEAAKLMNGGHYYKVRDLLAAHDALVKVKVGLERR